MWSETGNPKHTIEFAGLWETEFFDAEVVEEYKIKIDGNRLYCKPYYDKTAKEKQFEIIELSNHTLRLLMLPKGEYLDFTK